MFFLAARLREFSFLNYEAVLDVLRTKSCVAKQKRYKTHTFGVAHSTLQSCISGDMQRKQSLCASALISASGRHGNSRLYEFQAVDYTYVETLEEYCVRKVVQTLCICTIVTQGHLPVSQETPRTRRVLSCLMVTPQVRMNPENLTPPLMFSTVR